MVINVLSAKGFWGPLILAQPLMGDIAEGIPIVVRTDMVYTQLPQCLILGAGAQSGCGARVLSLGSHEPCSAGLLSVAGFDVGHYSTRICDSETLSCNSGPGSRVVTVILHPWPDSGKEGCSNILSLGCRIQL